MNTVIAQQIAKKGGIESWLLSQKNKRLLRFLTCGSVDDGKSTLIGRILYDTAQICKDHLSSLYYDSKRYGTQGDKLDLALLTDGLQAELEQGITIDVAYRYFSTEKFKFIITDTPGHEQYTRNMVTGASTCDVAVVLIDARKGVLNQTRRHTFISTLLGIKHLIVAINKMDLVEYKKDVFELIKKDFLSFIKKLPEAISTNFVPISALKGENVVMSSTTMLWYDGKTLLSLLENTDINTNIHIKSMRFPIQYVNRPDLDFRGYAGTLASGKIRVGQCVKVLPSGVKSSISRIVTFDGDLKEAECGEAVTIVLNDYIDISRGDVLIDAQEELQAVQSAIVKVVWMTDTPLHQGDKYIVKIAGKKTIGYIEKIICQININTLESYTTDNLSLNSIGVIEIIFEEKIVIDKYRHNHITGGMIFIDCLTNFTVGMGMIERLNNQDKRKVESYSDFELELNALIRRYFPYWNSRNLTDNKE